MGQGQGNTRVRGSRAEGTDPSGRRFGASAAERRRIEALRNLGIVDTASEDQYDGLVDVARRLARAPMAALSFVDEGREWPKAVAGATLEEAAREGSFGALVIDAQETAVIVADAAADPALASHPWVTQAGVRFYAAVPVSTAGGLRLGALAVMDTRPREDGEAVIEELDAVARILDGQLARRREHVVGGALTAVIDFDGVVRRLSPEWEQALGYRLDEMIGRPTTDFVHPDDLEKTIAEVERLSAGARTDGFESRYVRKDGEARWFLWRAQEILGDDLIYASARDITELKRGEEALRDAREAAERANLAKSRFLARMSHELRTPLNAMMGFAQLLELDDLDEEQADGVERILRGGRHMLEVINDVLDISRVEIGELSIEPSAVPAADVVEGVASFLRPLADGRGMTVRVQVADARAHVAADPRRLNQVLVNLVSNALKYGPEGSEVVVAAAPRDDAVEFTVRDMGPGIPPDRAARIFEPFERLPGHLHLEGTGLGLALSRNLVHAMDGSIGVRDGSPTEFWVVLPGAQPAATAAAEPDPEPVEAAACGAPGSTCTVLYVEDSPANVAFVERALALRPGVTLHAAADGATGLALARRHAPDLVLLDFGLPDIDGVEVLRELKADPGTAPIPVVAVTADATRGLDEQLLAAGAEAVEVKPLDVRRLLARVDAALR